MKRRLLERKVRLFLLGLAIYFAPRYVHAALNQLDVSDATDDVLERARRMNHRLWKSVVLVLTTVAMTIVFLALARYPVGGSGYWIRVAAVIFALTAALGRGGWGIQTWGGTSALEQIDRAMYAISQLGATALLLLVLSIGGRTA